ncbi:hypothetical protein FA95DRAFT_1610537 [Auriscalpium vulgare]|uniref:Uncharacterized protein n=1 Tax=Auriscalpium vulgare TaxID=40419 RepID=A0ACB8RDU8_9AGAM|nr:hypothetical protein FA95DRAFT_1610537 [Auriscalpium vulgare]
MSDNSDLLFQNSYYIGNNFNTILYGVQLVLYVMTMQRLVRTTRKSTADKFFIFHSTATLILITIYVAVESVFGEEMWIVNRDFPGGQGAYLATFAAVWYQTMGTTASVALNLLSDGLLIYRCYIVWSDFRVLIFPGILYLATLGVVELWASGAPHSDFFAGLAAHLGLAYYSLSIGLNVVVTSIICGRLLWYARTAKHYLGADVSGAYFSVAALIVESALPYSMAGIAFLVSYGLNSEISILFLSIYVMFTAVSPQMLVLRVVDGRAWKQNQMTDTSTTLDFTNSSRGQTNGSSQYVSGSTKDDGIMVRLETMNKTDRSVEDVGKFSTSGDSASHI